MENIKLVIYTTNLLEVIIKKYQKIIMKKINVELITTKQKINMGNLIGNFMNYLQ